MKPKAFRIIVHQGADFHWVANLQRENDLAASCDTLVHVHWNTVYTCWGTTKEEAVARADVQIAQFKAQQHREEQRDILYRSTMEILSR